MTTERYKHIPLMELIKLFYYDNVLYYIYEKQVCLVDTQENVWMQYPWSQNESVKKVQKINQTFYFYTDNNVYMLTHLGKINEYIQEEGYKYFFSLLQLDSDTQIRVCANQLGIVSFILQDDVILFETDIEYPIVCVFGFYLVITSPNESRTLILNIQQHIHDLQQAEFITLDYKLITGCLYNDHLCLLIKQNEQNISIVRFSSSQDQIIDIQLPESQQGAKIVNVQFLDDASIYVQTDQMILVYSNDLTEEPIQISPQQLHGNTLDSQYANLFKTLINEQPVFFVIRQTEASVVYFQDGQQITQSIQQPFFYINDSTLSKSEINIQKYGFPSYKIKQQGNFSQLTSTDIRLVSYNTTTFNELLNEAKEILQLDNQYDVDAKLIFYISQKSDETDENNVSRFQSWLHYIKQISDDIMISELRFQQIIMQQDSMSIFAIVQQNGQYEQLLFLGLYQIQHTRFICDLQTNNNVILCVIPLDENRFRITIKNTEVYDIVYSLDDGNFMRAGQQVNLLYKNCLIEIIDNQYVFLDMQVYCEKVGNIYELRVFLQNQEIQQWYKLYESKDEVDDVFSMFYDRITRQFIYLIKIKDEVKLCVYKITKPEILTLEYKCTEKTQIMQYSESYFIIFNNYNIDYLYDGKTSNLFKSTEYMKLKNVAVIPGLEMKQDGRLITLIRTSFELEGTLLLYDFLLQKEPPANRLNTFKEEKIYQQYDHIFAEINQVPNQFGMKQAEIYITCPSEYYLCIDAYDEDCYKLQKVVERDIIPLQETGQKLVFNLNPSNKEQLLFSYYPRPVSQQLLGPQNGSKDMELQKNVIIILKFGKNQIFVLNIFLDYFVFIPEREAFKKQWEYLKNSKLHSRYRQQIEQETHFQIQNEILGAVLIQNVLYCFEKTTTGQPIFEMAMYKIDIVSKRAKLLCTKRINMNNFLFVAIGTKLDGEINNIQFKKCYYEKVKDQNGMQRYNIIGEYLYQNKVILAKQDYKYNDIDYSMQQ